MKTMFSKLEMLQNVQFTLTTNSDLLFQISNEILAYNNCLNIIKNNLENRKEFNNSEVNEAIRKSLLPEFKFLALVLKSYAVMADQADILCDCKLKESNIEVMKVNDLFINFKCYLKFCKENASFLRVFGLTEDLLLTMETKLQEVNSVLRINSSPKNNSDLDTIIDEAQDILENEIDIYFESRKNESPLLYNEYMNARHLIQIDDNNSLQFA